MSVHFGPSFPVSDFGSDNIFDEDAGGAAVGFNIGLKYTYPLNDKGLGLFGGIDFNYNGLKKDFKDDVEDLVESLYGNVDIKFSKYINIPVTAGLHYAYQADDKIGVFANAGLAINFLKMTNMELKADGQKSTQKMDLAYGIGFKIGGGILINKKTSISVDYFGLGKHDMDGEVESGGSSQDIDGELKVDLLTLTLGFRF